MATMAFLPPRGDRPLRRPPRMARSSGLCAAVLFAMLTAPALAQTPQIPQIPAFLPTADQVPATQPMPLDGTWLVNTIRKKIRIEGGRAYAVDPWLHMFVLKVEPGMVVLRDIAPAAPGKYTGSDLPLMGQLTATVQADRSLAVSVQGALMPVQYKLIPVQLDNPQWYAQEMTAAGIAAPQSPAPGAYQPAPPAYQPAPPAYQPAPPQQAYQPPAQQPPAYQPPPAQQQQPYQPQAQPYQPPPAPAGTAQTASTHSWARSRNSTMNDSFGPPDLMCGEDGAEPCGEEKKVDAVFVEDAENWGCKGKQLYFTPHNGGECWRCPNGYKRTLTPIHKPKACKERGLGFDKREVSATFVRSAYGCPADTFESKGKCYACPEGSNKIAFLGAFNPGQSCKTEFYCDAGLSLQPAPPKALQQVGPPYDRVCGAGAGKEDVIRLSRERREAHQALQIVAGQFLLELAGNRGLRRAILDQDGPRAVRIIMQTPGFARLRDQSRASGFETLTFGGAPEVKAIAGAAQEAGLAMDWDGDYRFYMSTVVSTGASVSVGFTGTLGVWNASAGGIGGYARGASVSFPVGVGDVGYGAWFSYYPLDFMGLTFSASGGIGIDTVNYNQAVTNVY
ncbi:hypothetical protein [Lentisalinibacter orientalis]|uniref:hypothetical protein n=1 Tax=Lentisalinibacter orientalis TaxID=2992241 RepID=UPI00386ECFC2